MSFSRWKRLGRDLKRYESARQWRGGRGSPCRLTRKREALHRKKLAWRPGIRPEHRRAKARGKGLAGPPISVISDASQSRTSRCASMPLHQGPNRLRPGHADCAVNGFRFASWEAADRPAMLRGARSGTKPCPGLASHCLAAGTTPTPLGPGLRPRLGPVIKDSACRCPKHSAPSRNGPARPRLPRLPRLIALPGSQTPRRGGAGRATRAHLQCQAWAPEGPQCPNRP